MRLWFAALLTCAALVSVAAQRVDCPPGEVCPTPEPTPTPAVSVPWVVDCQDDLRANGYMMLDVCVPGEETYDASRFENPGYFSGAMSSYSEGIMEKTVANRGLSTGGYVGAVAVMGCNDIGKTAYIRRPGRSGWDGPFLVADCSGRYSVYVNTVVRGWAVEVDYETAKRFGASVLPWVDVHIQGNSGGFAGMALSGWYLKNVLSFGWTPALSPAPTPAPSPTLAPTPAPTRVREASVETIQVTAPVEARMAFAEVFFWLLVAHALGDFVFQSDKMGWEKRLGGSSKIEETPWGSMRQPMPTWPLWLSAHSLVHGGAVGLATGMWQLGVAETVAHWVIDLFRGQRFIPMYVDQALHIACKVVWALIVLGLQ